MNEYWSVQFVMKDWKIHTLSSVRLSHHINSASHALVKVSKDKEHRLVKMIYSDLMFLTLRKKYAYFLLL